MSKQDYKLKQPLLGWAKGEVLTLDDEWGEWTRKATGDIYNYRTTIRKGETAMLLNYLRQSELKSILEPTDD